MKNTLHSNVQCRNSEACETPILLLLVMIILPTPTTHIFLFMVFFLSLKHEKSHKLFSLKSPTLPTFSFPFHGVQDRICNFQSCKISFWTICFRSRQETTQLIVLPFSHTCNNNKPEFKLLISIFHLSL
jgi:hypothetical protein